MAEPAALPTWLSPSRAADFGHCPLRWYFTAGIGWRSPTTRPQLAGTITHESFEHLYELDPGDRTVDAALELSKTAWDTHTARNEGERLAADPIEGPAMRRDVEESVRGLFELTAPDALRHDELIGSEVEVRQTVCGAPILGRIDQLVHDHTYRIVDFKTGKPGAPGRRLDKLDGVWTYAAALAWQEPTNVPEEVELLYVRHNVRIVRPVIKAHLRWFSTELGRRWQFIIRAVTQNEYEALPGALCEYCPFQIVCPKFGSRLQPGSEASNAALAHVGLTRRSSPGGASSGAAAVEVDTFEAALSEAIDVDGLGGPER